MAQDVLDTLKKLVQDNDDLRNALGVVHDRAGAVQTLTAAATASKLRFTPEMIVTFLAQHYALPVSHESLDGIVGGKQEYNPFRDPYWTDADLPVGVTPGIEGKAAT
jgi:hypothetical protein